MGIQLVYTPKSNFVILMESNFSIWKSDTSVVIQIPTVLFNSVFGSVFCMIKINLQELEEKLSGEHCLTVSSFLMLLYLEIEWRI